MPAVGKLAKTITKFKRMTQPRTRLTLAQRRERKRDYMRRYRASPEGKASTRKARRSLKGRRYRAKAARRAGP
jgi:hypothetical protein